MSNYTALIVGDLSPPGRKRRTPPWPARKRYVASRPPTMCNGSWWGHGCRLFWPLFVHCSSGFAYRPFVGCPTPNYFHIVSVQPGLLSPIWCLHAQIGLLEMAATVIDGHFLSCRLLGLCARSGCDWAIVRSIECKLGGSPGDYFVPARPVAFLAGGANLVVEGPSWRDFCEWVGFTGR